MASFYHYNNSLYGNGNSPQYGNLYNKSLNQKQTSIKDNYSPLSSLGQMTITPSITTKPNYHYTHQLTTNNSNQNINSNLSLKISKDEFSKDQFHQTLNANFLNLYDKNNDNKNGSFQPKDSYNMINNFEKNHVNTIYGNAVNSTIQNKSSLTQNYNQPPTYKIPTPLIYGNSSGNTPNVNGRFGFNYGASNLYSNNKNMNAFFKQQEDPYYNNTIQSNRLPSSQVRTPYGLPSQSHSNQYQPTPSRKTPSSMNSNKKRTVVTKFSALSRPGSDFTGTTKTNQDSYLMKKYSPTDHVFGVFDGHGFQGHFVSQAISKFFNELPFESLNSPSALQSAFSSLSHTIKSSNRYDSNNSGSTCVLVTINSDKIYCANCGDSRAILLSGKNGAIISLSRDHKPDLPDERRRIEQQGGRVDRVYGMGPFRVWLKNENYPGLAMSRSIGDGVAHSVGVSDIPEIKEFDIEKEEPLALVVASDGVWEFMSNEEVKGIIEKYYYSKNTEGCSKEIVEKSLEKWKMEGYAVDDITAVVVFFE